MDVNALRVCFDDAGVKDGDVENARKQAVQSVERLLQLAHGRQCLSLGADLPFDHRQKQLQRLHRLAQIVAGGRQELRFRPVRQLGFGLCGHEFGFSLLLRADVAEEDRQASFPGSGTLKTQPIA